MFLKDLLIIDFEGGKGPKQIGAVLLDKETLEEKDHFESYIYFDMQGEPSMRSGITQDMLDSAPSPAEVGRKVYERFGTQVILGSFVSEFDHKHFRTLMNAAGIDPGEYDYHFLDVWGIAYAHLVKRGYQGALNSEEIFQEFGLPPRGLHNALEDARFAAEVLRKVMKE